MRRFLSPFLALSLMLVLSACDTAEERAEQYYQSALSLLEEGDVDRAIVELRNVFPLVPNHLEARHELARILLEEKDDSRQAYRQYLRLVEQYPDDLDARVQLAELAFYGANWDEMKRHGGAAIEINTEDPRVQIIQAALDYRAVIEEESATGGPVAAAMDLLEANPQSRILREILFDDLARKQEFSRGLEILDGLTTEFPMAQRYWRQRLQILIALDDQDAIEAQLVDMVERFPEDTEQKQLLVRYFLSRGELDKTEAFLREQVAAAPDDSNTPRVDLIRFLSERRSIADARVEIESAIASVEDATPFIMLGAALDFSTGDVDKAIGDLEAAIDGAEPSTETNEMKVTLSRMLLANENEVGARALVEGVLIDDPSQVGALKMNAAWLIDGDDTDGAISALRIALDSDPDDVETLSLMAQAYTRSGSPDLARDFLALAVEASDNAPEETVRYAQVLIAEERFLPAEDVLLPALRISPENLELLRTAAQLYMGMEDLGRMQQVVDTLRRIDTAESNQLAVQLETARINQSGGSDEALNYLENLASGADADIASRILLLRARLTSGDADGAIELAEGIVADEPDSPQVKLILATTLSAAGELDRAMEVYSELNDQYPNEASVVISLAALQARAGDPEQARATITDALVENPESATLLWASATYLENDGDIEGAIEVYEGLYALDSSNVVVANNLASLIATHSTDVESLDRAWSIARRFREADLPQIQDTYGWITHRRGDSNEALPYLESAAAALRTDAIVQFHLAEALFALERFDDALAQYRRTLEVSGVGDTRDQITTARSRISEIETIQSATE